MLAGPHGRPGSAGKGSAPDVPTVSILCFHRMQSGVPMGTAMHMPAPQVCSRKLPSGEKLALLLSPNPFHGHSALSTQHSPRHRDLPATNPPQTPWQQAAHGVAASQQPGREGKNTSTFSGPFSRAVHEASRERCSTGTKAKAPSATGCHRHEWAQNHPLGKGL